MIRVAEPTRDPLAAWSGTRLGYPLASVVVGAAQDHQDDRDATGRDEDRAR
jgi:hypothetical protein